jgi:Ni/Fe-hydrogenase subunit HybB-like protein
VTAAAAVEARTFERELEGPPVMLGEPTYGELTRQLLRPIWVGSWLYLPLLGLTFAGTLGLFALLAYTAVAGVGVWGVNVPVAWAFAITNFVWWIGIGHAGTFISAILLLFAAKWRTSINRIAEGMTLIAVVQAGLFPVFHLGRPWFAYWLFPYPSTMDVWPNFRSALPWDAAAVSTYFVVSFLFWYMGLVPDLAIVRDASKERWRRRLYGVFALGWRGSVRDWSHYRVLYGLLAGLATPLVISVHSIVSMDYAITQLPGWHSPLFPPYFVAGAIYSGFAMVLTLVVPVRRIFGLQNVITERHLENMAKMLLCTGWIVTYSYIVEVFCAWYSGDIFERYVHLYSRPFGPYAVLVWAQLFLNCVVVQVFWSRRARRSPLVLFGAAILINVGMWLERFDLIVTSLQRDFLPSSWHTYVPTPIDGGIFFGTLSFFFFVFLLFLRFVPFVPVGELKELSHSLASERTTAEAEARGAL